MDSELLPTAFDSSTCLKKGLCPVTKLRHQEQNPVQSHDIYYELHGSSTPSSEPKHKILLMIGLNSSASGWMFQMRHFPHTGQHEVLVFDNRGVGNSGYPRGPCKKIYVIYSINMLNLPDTTSAMAEDVIALLDYVGWTEKRSVNVVGISLGGMIAQELATRIPDRMRSLILAVTTPGGSILNNLMIPWKGIKSLATLTFTPKPEDKVPTYLPMLFPEEWLQLKAEGDDKGRTNYEVQKEGFLFRFSRTRLQRLPGNLSQMCAALSHYVSPDRLSRIAESIPKIYILTGDNDNLVRPIGSDKIRDAMGHPEKVEFIKWTKTGHGIHIQHEKKFNELIERACEEGENFSKLV
ncbi:alpha/beta-hydrolase [Flagelloscypha sp. PMI_526]|nr:alpha/beta-hydrolase [Flagelloscypha sp. PMI_526]